MITISAEKNRTVGGQPPNPRSLSLVDFPERVIWRGNSNTIPICRHFAISRGLMTEMRVKKSDAGSITLSAKPHIALGSLSSVALSSTWVKAFRVYHPYQSVVNVQVHRCEDKSSSFA